MTDYATRPQQIAVLFVQGFSSLLSVAGSTSIIYIIVRNQKWRKSMFHRLMLGLSIGDSIVSISTLIGPYLQPPNEHLLAASGNTASCSFSAVLLYCIISNVFYNCFISIFYYRTVRIGEREDRLSKAYEKWMHATAIGLSVVTNIVALSLHAFNPSESTRVCYIAYYPNDCDRNKDTKCTRGLYTTELDFAVLSLITIPAITGIVLTVSVSRHVNKVYDQSRRYRYEAEEQEGRRKRQIAKQAIVYCWAFINSFVWGLSSFVFDNAVSGETRASLGRPGVFAYLLLHAFFFPLQGFINYFVYTRPRYLKNRELYPERSYLHALSQVYRMSEGAYRSQSILMSRKKSNNNRSSQSWNSPSSSPLSEPVTPSNITTPMSERSNNGVAQTTIPECAFDDEGLTDQEG